MAQAAAAVAIVAPPAKPETEETETEAVAETVEAEAVAETVEPEAVAETTEAEAPEAVAETVQVEGVVEDRPQTAAEREAAMSAIAAAFEAAAQAEADASRAEAAAERAETAAGTEGSENGESGTEAAAAEDQAETDPRLEALAQSFDSAEAEAAASAAADQEEGIATFGEDALSKRLGTLVPENVRYPERQSNKSTPAATTQVVVVGLVSVASIASFKRHLGRATGVQSVGVSSGPDGEFVFAVAHGEDVSLRDMIPSLPGFQARVTNAGDGIINVTARDPESEG
jgi:hypothetical protein